MTKYLECKSVSEIKTDSSACVPHSCPKAQVKLPPIDLPTYDENVLCWQPYNQSIKVSVVDNSALVSRGTEIRILDESIKGSNCRSSEGIFSGTRESPSSFGSPERKIWSSRIDHRCTHKIPDSFTALDLFTAWHCPKVFVFVRSWLSGSNL